MYKETILQFVLWDQLNFPISKKQKERKSENKNKHREIIYDYKNTYSK